MSFSEGFIKTSGLLSGLSQAGKETIQDALTLKGLRDSIKDIRGGYKGRMADLIKTQPGRDHLGTAIGKSLPSAAALTGYGLAAKKIKDKVDQASRNSYDQQYYQGYY